MPPLQLTNLLHSSLPHVSEKGRALLSALACVNGRPESTTELAHWLGFHDRYQLARALKREGLPPVGTLGAWTHALYWIIESQATGATLRELARREKMDPAVAYKLIRRTTGRRWSEMRRDGLTGAILSFRDRCRSVNGAPPIPAFAMESRSASRVQLAPPLTSARVDQTRSQPRARLRGVLGERVAIDGAPFDVALASTVALVTRGHAAAVDVLALNGAPRVTRTIAVGPVPTRVVPSARADRACVTSQFGEAVDIIDLEQGRLATTIPVPGHPLGAVLSRDGQTLYVSTNRDRLVAIALARRAVVVDIAIPHGSPHLCRHPSGHRLYASGWRAGVVAEIDVPAMRLVRAFKLGGIVQEVAVSADGQNLYAANEAGWLDVVHLPTGKRTGTLKLGTAALGMALSADEADIIIGLLHAGIALVVDRHTLEIRHTLRTGGKPRVIASHPKSSVLVANEAGWVDFIY
jgi:DNA-binding beta-propeller fold protein YncE